MVGSSPINSSLSPDLLIASRTSSFCAIPMSPCMGSAGWRNIAGEPVETMVEAIFWAMMPDLPMPVTITFPGQA